MIPHSALLDVASRYSRTLSFTCDLMRGDAVVKPDLPVTGGKISADRANNVRMSCDIDLALENWEDDPVDINVHRFRIKRGFTSLGVQEQLTLGTFRVDSKSREDSGTVSIKGSGLEAYVIDARFLAARTPPYGVSTLGTIRNLIVEVLPAAVVVFENTRDKPVQMTAPWDRERWDAIAALGESIGAEVFVDWRGWFIIRDIPDLTVGAPVWRVNEGEPDGVLLTRSIEETRDRVYNAVSVSGDSSDSTVAPVWGWAYDSNPLSKTYYYGDFGQVPMFYTSQFFTTEAQCVTTARRMLAEALAANSTLKFDMVAVNFLEVGDLVQVQLADLTEEVHLLTKTDYDLSTGASLSCETLGTKNIATGDF